MKEKTFILRAWFGFNKSCITCILLVSKRLLILLLISESWMRPSYRVQSQGGRMWSLWRGWFLMCSANVPLGRRTCFFVFGHMWRWYVSEEITLLAFCVSPGVMYITLEISVRSLHRNIDVISAQVLEIESSLISTRKFHADRNWANVKKFLIR